MAAVYLATPAPLGEAGQNPFNSLIALYIVAEDPDSGYPRQARGRIANWIRRRARSPRSLRTRRRSRLKNCTWNCSVGRARRSARRRSARRTAPKRRLRRGRARRRCRRSQNPPASTSIPVRKGRRVPPAQQPFAPGLRAGVTNLQGGAFTTFTLRSQPPGWRSARDRAARCICRRVTRRCCRRSRRVAEPQASLGTCGPESEIGQAVASSGLGPDPFTVTGGRVYITGPYQGAPFGLSIVTPAVAGPFNLGNVVVRSTYQYRSAHRGGDDHERSADDGAGRRASARRACRCSCARSR